MAEDRLFPSPFPAGETWNSLSAWNGWYQGFGTGKLCVCETFGSAKIRPPRQATTPTSSKKNMEGINLWPRIELLSLLGPQSRENQSHRSNVAFFRLGTGSLL